MSKQRVQRNFRPWPENQERLEFAEKIGLNARAGVLPTNFPPRFSSISKNNDRPTARLQ